MLTSVLEVASAERIAAHRLEFVMDVISRLAYLFVTEDFGSIVGILVTRNSHNEELILTSHPHALLKTRLSGSVRTFILGSTSGFGYLDILSGFERAFTAAIQKWEGASTEDHPDRDDKVLVLRAGKAHIAALINGEPKNHQD